MSTSRQCNKCGEFKENSAKYFEPRQENGNLRNTCRVCRNKRRRRPATNRARWQRYRSKHSDKIKARRRRRNGTHGVRVNLLIGFNERVCVKCSDIKSDFNYRKTICDECYKTIKRAKDSRNLKRRLKEDPAYKFRIYTSNAIGRALRRRNGSKCGQSIMQFLPYTMSELIEHIESQWEPWMNWDNYGSFEAGRKKWHIDHIISQDKLSYDSMDHPNFRLCWSLTNLRPLEAFENMRKSNK